MFTRSGTEGPVGGNGVALIAKQSTPLREPGTSSKNPIVHARGEESADEMMAQKNLSSANNVFEKKADPGAPAKPVAGKENDAWDIPAFLRRRKR